MRLVLAILATAVLAGQGGGTAGVHVWRSTDIMAKGKVLASQRQLQSTNARLRYAGALLFRRSRQLFLAQGRKAQQLEEGSRAVQVADDYFNAAHGRHERRAGGHICSVRLSDNLRLP